jgi:beta-galactosidase
MNKKFIVVPLLCYTLSVASQMARTEYTINSNWRFWNNGIASGQNKSSIDDSSWDIVNIPHTWNAEDPFDDVDGYKRGIAWYRKNLELSKNELQGKRVFLNFEGANQVTDVYVNNRMVGRHKGGYTGFKFDITDALIEGESQLIAVCVNNAHDPYIAPLSVGYALYGGIYRDVWVVVTDDVHFDMDDFGSNGIKINTTGVSSKSAAVSVSSSVVNDGTVNKKVEVIAKILNNTGAVIAEKSTSESILPGERKHFEQTIDMDHPHLWSPDDPYLYTVSSVIKSEGRVIDKVDNPMGVRWFSFDPEEGFSINGNHIKLKGTNRHQDFKGKGSALSNGDHRRDMEMIKNMGCNFIRIAHYPQDPEILRAADELGLIAWEEIPLVNYMSMHPEFYKNSVVMLKEMIRQHYNHPSVVMWGSMNEIFLYGSNEDRIRLQDDTAYVKGVQKYAVKLDSIIRAEDPNRYSTMAMHMSSDYERYGIEDIAQVVGFNVYSGWYGGELNDFGVAFDKRRQRKPSQVVMISEYGAGSDPRLNSENPKRFDFTGQYQLIFHESYLRQINNRKFIAGGLIWNQFDFSQPDIGGSISHLNQKGLATWDRKPKDSYYFYKTNWNSEPMVYIAEKDWLVRATIQSNPSYNITVYSNTKKVELYFNGNKVGSKSPNEVKKTSWTVKLKEGDNSLRAVGTAKDTKVEDETTIKIKRFSTSNLTSLRINVGSNAQYLDQQSNPWIEDSPFNGLYGFSDGGESTLLFRKSPIRGSEDEPIYYSCLENLKNYKVRVPYGSYVVTLYFLENKDIKPDERVFDVSANGKKIISNLDLTKEAGFCQAVKKSFNIDVTNGEIDFVFKAQSGRTLLNGLEVIKVNY